MIEPLASDIAAWKAQQPQASPDALVFPATNGEPWTEDNYRNWRRRNFRAATESAGLTGLRVYDLRHTFVSLLIQEGRSIVDIARQAGHSPTMTLNTYAHVFDDLDPSDRTPAESRVTAARAQWGPPGCVRNVSGDSQEEGSTPSSSTRFRIGIRTTTRGNKPISRLRHLADVLKPSNGLEPLTPSLPWKQIGRYNVFQSRQIDSTKLVAPARQDD